MKYSPPHAALFFCTAIALAAGARQASAQTLTVSPAFTLTAQGLDYQRNYTEATGGNGISATIAPQGQNVSLTVESTGGTLADADVLVRSTSAGSVLTQYAALTIPLDVWKGAGNSVLQIQIDLRVKNLRAYAIDSAPSKALLFTLTPDVG